MGFMDANKSSDLLAWWTLDEATLSRHYHARTHASLRLASEQVSSRFRAGFGPDSIMDFGLYNARGQSATKSTQITKVRDMICVADFHDLCPRLSPRGSFGESRKVGVMEFGLNSAYVRLVRSADERTQSS